MGEKHANETEEERNQRKRAKKEAKNLKQEQTNFVAAVDAGTSNENHGTPLNTPSTTAAPSSSSSTKVEGTKRKPSPFERKKVKLTVSLFPVALGNVLENVRRSLRSLLLKYSDGIGGVLLAFDNVRLAEDANGAGGNGVILNEMPHIHFQVELDALVFCPMEGVKLTGVINECFPSHVGMLVHSFFNAMVSSDHLQTSGYAFDQDLDQWIPEEGTQALGIGGKVEFTVEKLHECAGVISLEGSQPSVALEKES